MDDTLTGENKEKIIQFEAEILPTTDGKEKLYWKSWKPKEAIGTVTFVHGQSEHCSRYDAIFGKFAIAGLHVNCFDLRGHGQSTGIRGHTPFESIFEDISLIVSKADPKIPHIIYGHSMGGLLVLSYVLSFQQAKKLPQFAGVVTTGALLRLTHPLPGQSVISKVLSAISETTTIKNGVKATAISRDKDEVEKYVKDHWNHGLISFKAARDISVFSVYVMQNANNFSHPLLILHGGADDITDHKASEQFSNKVSSSDKTLKIYPGLYHEIHNELKEAREEVIQNILDWLLGHCKATQSTTKDEKDEVKDSN